MIIAVVGMWLLMALIYIWASWFVVEPVRATVYGLLFLVVIYLLFRVLIACSTYDEDK